MGLLEAITHKEEIQQLLSEAKTRYDGSTDRMEKQKSQTTSDLERLGKLKVEKWANDMTEFTNVYNSFKDITVEKKEERDVAFVEPEEMMVNIKNATVTAGEVIKTGFAAVGSGALVGVASYGGAMMFGAASTGTAIASLTGIAKTNAVLAWFGGGAKAVGGLGILGGKVVLAGIVMLPIFAVGGLIAGAKGKEKLAEAKKVHAEAFEAAEKMDTVTTGLQGISAMSREYSSFITRLSIIFMSFIEALKRITEKHSPDASGKIDFNSLDKSEQKTVHLSWLLVQLFYNVLNAPIMNDQGYVDKNAESTLSSARSTLKTLRRETINLTGEVSFVANNLWEKQSKAISYVIYSFSIITAIVAIIAIRSSHLEGILLLFTAIGAALTAIIDFRISENRVFKVRLCSLLASIIAAVIVIVSFGGIK